MHSKLMDILPVGYIYEEVSFTELKNCTFDATVRTNIKNHIEAEEWLQKFEAVSFTNFRVSKTFPNYGQKVLFKKVFRCHHSTRAQNKSVKVSKGHVKHTCCPAKLNVTIKNVKMKRSKDRHLRLLPCEINIQHVHNHPLKCADVLRHRRPTDATKEKFLVLYQNGHSPSSALYTHKFDLQEEYEGDKYLEVVADGSICPNLQWCFHQYYMTFKKKYRSIEGAELLRSLLNVIENYNTVIGSMCAAVDVTDEGPIVAVCSPLMKRVHQNVRECSEVIFVDLSGAMDRNNTRVLLFSTPTAAGVLPLGVIFTCSESQDILTKGLSLWQSILPEKSFFGCHSPNIIMTSDGSNERNALSDAFPSATLLLDKVHVLQAFWRNLWNSKMGVPQIERLEIFSIFKEIVNATDKTFVDNLYCLAMSNALVCKYSKVQTHLEKLRERVNEWCTASHTVISTEHNHVEVTYHVLKDIVLGRIRAYNVAQLFDFIVTRCEAYFVRRIVDVANNRGHNHQRSRYFIPEERIQTIRCTKISKDIYEIFDNKSNCSYILDMSVGVCSCQIGLTGVTCKHQYAVSKQFNLLNTELFFRVSDPESRQMLLELIVPSTDEYNSSVVHVNEARDGVNDDVTERTNVESVEEAFVDISQEWYASLENSGIVKVGNSINTESETIRIHYDTDIGDVNGEMTVQNDFETVEGMSLVMAQDWFGSVEHNEIFQGGVSTECGVIIECYGETGIGLANGDVAEKKGLQTGKKISDTAEEINLKTEARISLFRKRFKLFYANMINKVGMQPDVFLPACETFLNNYDELKTESSLLSAICNFGSEDISCKRKKSVGVSDAQINKRTRLEHNYVKQNTTTNFRRIAPRIESNHENLNFVSTNITIL